MISFSDIIDNKTRHDHQFGYLMNFGLNLKDFSFIDC